jgi:hypothetical protein
MPTGTCDVRRFVADAAVANFAAAAAVVGIAAASAAAVDAAARTAATVLVLLLHIGVVSSCIGAIVVARSAGSAIGRDDLAESSAHTYQ